MLAEREALAFEWVGQPVLASLVVAEQVLWV